MQVAIKILTVQFSARCSRAIAKARDIRNEVEVMKKINHVRDFLSFSHWKSTNNQRVLIENPDFQPNVVAIYDWVSVAKYSYMVIEYVGGGEFFSKIVDPKYNRMGLGESLGKYFTFQLVDAVMVRVAGVLSAYRRRPLTNYNYQLQYLHSLNICHRDIKPENILCSDKSERCILKVGYVFN